MPSTGARTGDPSAGHGDGAGSLPSPSSPDTDDRNHVDTGVQRYLEALGGVTALTRAHAERTVRQLVRQGEVASGQVGDAVQDMLRRSRHNGEQLGSMVADEVHRAVRTIGLATADEVEALRKQVADLKRELARATRTEDPR